MVRMSLRYRHLAEVAVAAPSSKLYLEQSQSARYYLDQVSHLEISPNINGTSTGVNQDSRFRASKQHTSQQFVPLLPGVNHPLISNKEVALRLKKSLYGQKDAPRL